MGITAIRKVSAWTTSDGKPFTVRAEAVAHEARLNLNRLIAEAFSNHDVADVSAIQETLADRASVFADAFEALVKAEKRLADVRSGATDDGGQGSVL